jgi:hypothetical protein
MKIKERINLLSRLKPLFDNLVAKKPWTGYELGINESEYLNLQESIIRAKVHNPWFTEESVLESLSGLSTWLNDNDLSEWVESYNFTEDKSKSVAIIMAGNIPLVGFHDFLAVFLSGKNVVAKLSSDDKILLPAIIDVLRLWNDEIDEVVTLSEGKLPQFDAVIATGSDNSAMYFESYFGKYPHIIRKNRTSIAVLTGNESKKELETLGKDIFTYFGLGCRNVSKLLIPQDFVLDRFFEAIVTYGDIVNHNKYGNNYDYNKAVYLMNLLPMLDNNFIILKEDESLHSPLGVLFYQRYSTSEELNSYIDSNKEKLQVVVGQKYMPFGKAQTPSLTDYADGVNTLDFLAKL